MGIQAPYVYADLSKNLVSNTVHKALIKLADNANLKDQTRALFSGQELNATEHRAVLHTALPSLQWACCWFPPLCAPLCSLGCCLLEC